MRPGEKIPPLLAAAEALHRQRMANFMADRPSAHCLPHGIPDQWLIGNPVKIVQDPSLTIILYEQNTHYRQIFTDGRPHPPGDQSGLAGLFHWPLGRRLVCGTTRAASTIRVGSMTAAARIPRLYIPLNASTAATSGTWISKSPSTIPKPTPSPGHSRYNFSFSPTPTSSKTCAKTRKMPRTLWANRTHRRQGHLGLSELVEVGCALPTFRSFPRRTRPESRIRAS